MARKCFLLKYFTCCKCIMKQRTFLWKKFKWFLCVQLKVVFLALKMVLSLGSNYKYVDDVNTKGHRLVCILSSTAFIGSWKEFWCLIIVLLLRVKLQCLLQIQNNPSSLCGIAAHLLKLIQRFDNIEVADVNCKLQFEMSNLLRVFRF